MPSRTCDPVRQLFPVVRDPVDPADVYADVPIAADRPGVRLNMIASADGATAVNGRSGALGGPADRTVFMALRSLTDMILVAAGTARTEGYGPARLSESVQAERGQRGQTPVPAIAVVTRTAALDWDSPFFTEATARPIVVTVSTSPNQSRASEVADVVIAGDDDVDLRRALDALAERGARSVLAEGGPSLNAQLAGAGLLDELCLTLAPSLVGGDAKRIVSGPAFGARHELRLISVCEEDDFLFLRYGFRR